MSTISVINAGITVVADGLQTVFEIDLVAAPIGILQPAANGVAGAPAMLNPGFDLLRPKPVEAVRLNIGSTAVLSGYKVIVTFDIAPTAGSLAIQFQLHYSR